MPRQQLQSLNIDDDVLQMSERYTPTGERIVHIDLKSPDTRSPKELVRFSTDRFDIFDTRALTVEGTVFKSLEAYCKITTAKPTDLYKRIENRTVTNALQFLSRLELYHLQAGEMPWLDVKFYFRPWFEVSATPLNIDLKKFNSRQLLLGVELDLMDSMLVFFTESPNAENNISLFKTDRYELSVECIYSAIRNVAKVTANPQTITNTILRNL